MPNHPGIDRRISVITIAGFYPEAESARALFGAGILAALKASDRTPF